MTKTSTKKPDLGNMSLEDIIKKEKPKRKPKKKSRGAPQEPSNVDYEKFSDDQIRKELSKRGMPTKGSRAKLVARLKHCVRQAWEQYNKSAKKGVVTQKKQKKKLSAEEKLAITEENEANRLANLKRKLESKKKQEQARERKRQKREASMKKREAQEESQKVQKEARQVMEAMVQFDMKSLEEQIRRKYDPKGNKLSNVSYDFSKTGFVLKFNKPQYVEMATKGATISKPASIKCNVTSHILPAPLESKCVFFLAPTAFNHPNKAAADEWLEGEGAADEAELVKLNHWIESAMDTFKSCGKIINVYRERGFLVVYFAAASSVGKFMSDFAEDEFNGVPLVFVKKGTPTKHDRMVCDEQNPRPKKAKKKN